MQTQTDPEVTKSQFLASIDNHLDYTKDLVEHLRQAADLVFPRDFGCIVVVLSSCCDGKMTIWE